MHEEMIVLTEVIIATLTLMEIPSKIAYLEIDKQADLITQIAIPPSHAEVDTVATTDFKIE